MKKTLEKAICPDCGAKILVDLKKVEVGEILECEACACEVELVSLKPLKVLELLEEK